MCQELFAYKLKKLEYYTNVIKFFAVLIKKIVDFFIRNSDILCIKKTEDLYENKDNRKIFIRQYQINF